jgi:hypothetical protein
MKSLLAYDSNGYRDDDDVIDDQTARTYGLEHAFDDSLTTIIDPDDELLGGDATAKRAGGRGVYGAEPVDDYALIDDSVAEQFDPESDDFLE